MSRQTECLMQDAAQFVFEEKKKHFVGGGWMENSSAQSLPVHSLPVMDPCTGEVLTTIPLAGASEVDSAVRAAQAAFPVWAAKPAAERAALVHRFADAIERKSAVLAQIEAIDVGKPVTNAEAFDIPFGAECLRLLCRSLRAGRI